MIKNNNFKFEVSLSLDTYANKEISDAMIGNATDSNKEIRKNYGYRANKGVGYIRTEVTPLSLYEALTNGKVMCHLFNPSKVRTDGTFGSYEKKDEYFAGSYVIGVDIDETNFNTVEEYVNALSLKPTFYYTTYSNGLPNKGLRFRLIYVFNDIVEGKYNFRYAAWKLYNIIEADTKEEIKDKCGLKCSQYFNGTNKNNSELIFKSDYTGMVYDYEDLDCNLDDFIDFADNYFYFKSKTKEIKDMRNEILNKFNSQFNNSDSSNNITTTYYNDLQKNEQCENEVEESINSENSESVENNTRVCTESLVNDMSRLSYDEFMLHNSNKYHYFYRVESDDWNIDELNGVQWQYTLPNYFSLYWNLNVVQDGCARRKKLYERMCLRRIMHPEVNADTLLYNAYVDLNRFFNNNPEEVKNVITIDELVKNVYWALDKDIEDIESDFSENLAYLRSKAPKRGKIYRFTKRFVGINESGKKIYKEFTLGERNSIIKIITWQTIGEIYDVSLSVKENLEILNNSGIKVSLKTLYNFCNENDINTKESKLNIDSEMMSHYDSNKSLRNNLTILKDMGYKISLGKLSKLASLF